MRLRGLKALGFGWIAGEIIATFNEFLMQRLLGPQWVFEHFDLILWNGYGVPCFMLGMMIGLWCRERGQRD